MKKSTAFSAAGSLLIVAFLFFVNYITSWGHPWFVYPTFVVLWWPLAMFFAAHGRYRAFAISGSVLTSVFFFLVNYITSWAYPWFIFPVFAIWWWPLSLYTAGQKRHKLFSIMASLYISVFFYVVNLFSAPDTVWFIYPMFAVLWWPISYIICSAKKYKLYSVVASLYFSAFLAFVNYLTSPGYVWFYYPAYALLWWPMSMFFLKKNAPRAYSLTMTAVTVVFLALINLMNSPDLIWFPYTIFYLLWWPAIAIAGKRAKSFGFAAIGALVIIAYHVAMYHWLTPLEHPWYLYIIPPAIWWPVCTALKRYTTKVWFLLISLAVFVVYYVAVNLSVTPEYFWSIYLIYPVIWAVMGIYFGVKRKPFAFSLVMSAVTIAFFSIVNYMTSPGHIWAIYPTFAVLWWPLILYFYRVRKREKMKDGMDLKA